MHQKMPFNIILSRHITEKSRVLEQLQFNTRNPCVKKCTTPKYVFLVDRRANKQEIAAALEEIYKDKKIRVISVNTLTQKPKPRRIRGRSGMRPGFKKAVVTLEAGDAIEENA